MSNKVDWVEVSYQSFIGVAFLLLVVIVTSAIWGLFDAFNSLH